MKKNATMTAVLAVISLFMTAECVNGQSLDQRLQYFTTGYAKGYVQPLVDAFGANMNSGLYHSADCEKGLSLYAGVQIMGAFLPSSAETFSIASPYNGEISKTATVIGGSGTAIPHGVIPLPPGAPDRYLDGASDFKNVKIVPLAVPQISAGNFMGTQLMLRYLPPQDLSGVGKLSFFGVGIQHSISRYIPLLPVNLSAQVAYQSFTIGDNFDAKAFSIGAQVSKSLVFFSLYGGLAYEKSTVSFSYNYTNPMNNQTQKLSLDFTGANSVRATVGITFNILILKVNADYSLGKIPIGCVGVGIGL